MAIAATLRDAAIALVDPQWHSRAIDAYQELSIEAHVADLTGRLATLEAPALVPKVEAPTGELVREGEYWRLTWAGRSVHVRDSKGVRDLPRLLGQPGREVPALDLAAAPGAVTGGDLGEVVDARAREAYRSRLAELAEEIDDADRTGDAQRSARATTERDALVEQLASAYGLGGRPRRAGDPAERARTTVANRIRHAIGRMTAVHPDLGRHLERAVRTGR